MPSYESTEEYLNSTQIGRQIIRIRENVSAALTAIEAKGVTVPSGATSDDLADLIAQIQTGGGEGPATEVIIPEQTISASSMYTLIPNVVEALIEGEEYIYTVNGVSEQGTAVNYYGSIALITSDRRLFFDNSGGTMYFDVMDASLYGSYTIKVEKITSN